MKLIYKARDIIEAHIILGLLKSNGIEAHVGGLYLQGGIGDLAAMDFATVSVEDEDVEIATSIISEYDKNTHSKKSENKVRSRFTVPLIVLVFSVIMMLLLAIFFSDYR